LGFILLLSGCSRGGTLPLSEMEPTMTPETSPSTFRIIGYAPEWDTVVQEIQFDKLTQINYAFLLPKPDGSFEDLEHPDKLKDLVTEAHNHDVKVLISIGGWGYDEQFETLAADPDSCAAFVQKAGQFAQDYALDGIDIDWEYPDEGESSQNYLKLMQDLRGILPEGKLLTSAVVSQGSLAEGIPAEVFPVVDFLNIMVYDESETDHSPYWAAEEALDYWQGRGLPPEKTVLGVPFYGRPEGIAYRKLVQTDPSAADGDVSEFEGKKIYYNGMATMQRKTELAMQRASGIMIWELAHDTLDSTSLLGVISQTATKSK
jgi:chitinase